jgi:flagellar assembly protein FliH
MTEMHARPALKNAIGMLFVEDFDDQSGITVFDDPDPLASPDPHAVAPEIPKAIDVDLLRAEAFAAGADAAREQADAQRAAAAARLFETLAGQLAETADFARAHAETIADAVAGVALGAVAALLPAACAKHGQAEAAALAEAILPGLVHAPHVVIRLHPDTAEVLAPVIARLDPEMRGRVVVIPTETFKAADLRISWQDGQASSDLEAVARDIGATFARFGLIDTPRIPAAAAASAMGDRE